MMTARSDVTPPGSKPRLTRRQSNSARFTGSSLLTSDGQSQTSDGQPKRFASECDAPR
jgi:hypothetical protein